MVTERWLRGILTAGWRLEEALVSSIVCARVFGTQSWKESCRSECGASELYWKWKKAILGKYALKRSKCFRKISLFGGLILREPKWRESC